MTTQPTHSLVKLLRTVPDFVGLSEPTLLKVVGASANLAFAPEATVFEAGSPSEALYVILSGRIRIFDDAPGGGGGDVAVLGRGDSFGEISLLRRTGHTKSAQAVEVSELMVLPRESFEELLEANVDLKAHFEQRIVEREAVRREASES